MSEICTNCFIFFIGEKWDQLTKNKKSPGPISKNNKLDIFLIYVLPEEGVQQSQV